MAVELPNTLDNIAFPTPSKLKPVSSIAPKLVAITTSSTVYVPLFLVISLAAATAFFVTEP